jgi:hypothetical protein
MIYFAPKDAKWENAWKVTEGLLMLMRDEVTAKGAEFLVVTLTNGIQVHPDPTVRQTFADRLGLHSLFYPDFRIKALEDREKLFVMNLAPLFLSYAEQHKRFLHGFGDSAGTGHWNSEGHSLAGKTIAQKLCQHSAKNDLS